jgi:hypothetical protein
MDTRTLRAVVRRAPAPPLTLLVTLALLVTVVVVAQAAPALAGSLTVRDATGDMWVVEEGSNEPDPAPHARIGDIERTTYRHTAHRVVVRTRFVELAPVGRRFTLWIGMLDEHRRETTVGVRATRRDRDGHTILMDDHGRDIACDVRHRVRYGRDVIRVVVPRSCLGDPARLRFSTLSEQWGRRLFFANLDDGLTAREPRVHWTAPVRHG